MDWLPADWLTDNALLFNHGMENNGSQSFCPVVRKMRGSGIGTIPIERVLFNLFTARRF
jgi:hypothetical protein